MTAAPLLAALVSPACSDSAPEVAAVSPERRDLVSYLVTNGRLHLPDQTAVHAAASGRIADLLVEKGAQAQAGQVLARLADSGERAARRQSQAKLDAARAELADFERGPPPAERAGLQARLDAARGEHKRLNAEIERATRLIDRQAAARSELDKLQAEAAAAKRDMASLAAKLHGPLSEERRSVLAAAVRGAEAALRQADERAAALEIRAPAAGVVYALAVGNGDYIQQGAPIARIGSPQRLRAAIFIDEPELGRVAQGSKTVIAADAYPGASWPCTIEDLAVEIVELGTRRVGEVFCTVENADGRLLPNLTVSARIETGSAADALSVPRGAVVREWGETFVWVAACGKASRRPVGLGLQGADFVEIAAGLTEADTVLLPGAAALIEGRPVRLKPRPVEDLPAEERKRQ